MKFLIKKSPDGFIKSVNDEISSILNRNFDSFFPEYIYNEEIDKLAMPVELHEKDKEYTVKAELPGVKKEDLDIDIDKNHITINAKKEEVKKIPKVIENQNSATANFQELFISLRKLMLKKLLQNLNTVFCV